MKNILELIKDSLANKKRVHCFVDLEDTLIKSWDDRKTCHLEYNEQVFEALSKHHNIHYTLLSWAVNTKEEIREFLTEIEPKLEPALRFPNILTPDEVLPLVRESIGGIVVQMDIDDMMTFFWKERVLSILGQQWAEDGDLFVLVDDTVSEERRVTVKTSDREYDLLLLNPKVHDIPEPVYSMYESSF